MSRDGGRIELRDLPRGLREDAGNGSQNVAGTLQEMERKRIIEALDEAVGNKKLAAKRLGIHRSTLYAKMRRFGLSPGAEADSPARSCTS